MAAEFVIRAAMTEDLRSLGLVPGDVVLAHGALASIGRLLNGPDAVVGALLDAVSPGGTVLAYTDCDARYDELLDDEGRVPDEWRPHVPPFDPMSSRANRENGALPEFLHTWPGAHRSANPGASFAALGARRSRPRRRLSTGSRLSLEQWTRRRCLDLHQREDRARRRDAG